METIQWFMYYMHWVAIYTLWVIPVGNVIMNMIQSKEEEVCTLSL